MAWTDNWADSTTRCRRICWILQGKNLQDWVTDVMWREKGRLGTGPTPRLLVVIDDAPVVSAWVTVSFWCSKALTAMATISVFDKLTRRWWLVIQPEMLTRQASIHWEIWMSEVGRERRSWMLPAWWQNPVMLCLGRTEGDPALIPVGLQQRCRRALPDHMVTLTLKGRSQNTKGPSAVTLIPI